MPQFNLHTQSGRSKLKPRVAPYWQRLAKGRFVGLHVNDRGRMYWRARLYIEAQQDYEFKALDECVDGVFEFDEAASAAQAWFDDETFRRYGRRTQKGPYTVGDACRDHIKRRLAAMEDAPLQQRCALQRLFERVVLGNAPNPQTGKYKRGQSGYLPDPIASVPMTERDLTASVINDWLMRRRARVMAGRRKSKVTTINQEFKQLRAALNAAIDAQLAPVTVRSAWKCTLNKPLKVNSSDKRRHGYLTSAEVNAWIKQLDGTPADLLRAQYLIGCRPGREINQLRRADFDDTRRTLTIREGKTKFRVIALSADAFALFKRISRDKLPGAYLFTGPKGSPVDTHTYQTIFRTAASAAKLPAATVPYCLRHSFITDMLSCPTISETALATHCGTSVEMFRKHYFHLRAGALGEQLTQVQRRARA